MQARLVNSRNIPRFIMSSPSQPTALARPAGYRLTKMWTVAEFPARAGIDTGGLATEEELQIKSRQDWERGLSGGDIGAETYFGSARLNSIEGSAEATRTAADCAVYSVAK